MRKLLLAGLAAFVFVAPTAARQSAGNLLRDGGAEEAQATDGNSVISVPGWSTTGTFTAGVYGMAGLPPTGPPGGGKNLFTGGPGGALSTATQTVDVSSSAVDIDARAVNATLDGWLGGWESQADAATVSAEFRDASGKALATVTIGPVTAAQRGNQSKLLQRTAKGNVPAGTRSIRVTITARRASGNYNDGYADNISLSLAAGPARSIGISKATFQFTGRSSDAVLRPPADYLASQVRGSGSVKLEHSVQTGSAKITSGTGTIRLIDTSVLHTEKLWLAVHGGGHATRFDLVGMVVGVTASNSQRCPKGRAGSLTLADNSGVGPPDTIRIVLCGRRYFFEDRTTATVRIHLG